ncbi:hypothetical protein Tco_1039656 [Tanacetum coccineum]
MVISDDEEDLVLEDPSKQGRMTETEYKDVDVETEYEEVEYELDQTDTLQQITPTKVSQGEEQSQESSEVQLDVLSAAKILANASSGRVKTYKSYTRKRRSIVKESTAGGLFSTAEEILSTDERIAQKLNEEEMAKAAAREEQERINFGKALEYYKKISNTQEETSLSSSSKEEYDDLLKEYEPIQEQPTKEPKELSEEELKKMLEIVPVEEIKAEALQVKYHIIDWEIHTKGSRKYWKIIRVRNIIKAYEVFEDMLKGFDREDLVTLWSLVKERFRSAEPTEDIERALWVKLKRLFEPDKDDVLWKLQKYMHDPLTWRLYNTCGVHHISSTRGHDIYMLTEKDYPRSSIVMGLMLSRRLQVEEDSEMARDLVMKIIIEANKPRS